MKNETMINPYTFGLVAMCVSVLGLARPTMGGELMNVQLTPTGPVVLPAGTHVVVSFDYVVSSDDVKVISLILLDDHGQAVIEPWTVMLDRVENVIHGEGWFTAGAPGRIIRTVQVYVSNLIDGEACDDCWWYWSELFPISVDYTFSTPTAIRATTWGRLKMDGYKSR